MALIDGTQTVATAGTRVALGASRFCYELAITASEANTGKIVVGGVTVVASAGTRRGTPLAASDTLTMEDVDLAEVYLDGTVSGDGVSFTGRA